MHGLIKVIGLDNYKSCNQVVSIVARPQIRLQGSISEVCTIYFVVCFVIVQLHNYKIQFKYYNIMHTHSDYIYKHINAMLSTAPGVKLHDVMIVQLQPPQPSDGPTTHNLSFITQYLLFLFNLNLLNFLISSI